MPNWCFTEYRVYGPKEDRDKLKSILDELNGMEKPLVDNGFGNLWLGCLVHYLGGDENKIYCRGEITEYMDGKYYQNENNDFLLIRTETAWAEMYQTRWFLQEKFPSLKFYYMSEEPGMCEYFTNDKTGEIFHSKYFLDVCDIDIDSEYFATIEEVADYINSHNFIGRKVKASVDDICEACEAYEEEHEDSYIALHEFTYVSEDEEKAYNNEG